MRLATNGHHPRVEIRGKLSREKPAMAHCLDELAECISQTDFEALPESTLSAAKAVVLDTVDAIVAGIRPSVNIAFADLVAERTGVTEIVRGDRGNRAPHEELVGTFRRITEGLIAPDAAEQAISMIERLEDVGNLRRFAELLHPSPGPGARRDETFG